jgi:hypothetical protein
MTFSSPQIIRAKAEASLEQAQTAFWFPVLPGLQALPSTPAITTNGSPSPANAVEVPAGFNFDNPDLADLFENILPKGQPPVFPRTMGPAAGLVVPPFNEIQRWEARIRVPAEATLLQFSNEIVYVAAATLKVRVPALIAMPISIESGSGAGDGTAVSLRVALLASPFSSPAIELPATYTQSSVYASAGLEAATFVGMTNGIYNETRQTGTDSGGDQWVRMDFGSSQSYGEILVGQDLNYTLDGGAWGPGYANSKSIQKSDDGTSWTAIGSTGIFGDAEQYKVITVGAHSSRYVRIYNGGSGYLAVTELYARQPASGGSAGSGKAATVRITLPVTAGAGSGVGQIVSFV